MPSSGSRQSIAAKQQSTKVNSSLIKYGMSSNIVAIEIRDSLSSLRAASASLLSGFPLI